MSARKRSKQPKRQTQKSKNKWGPIIIVSVAVVGLIGLGYLLYDSLRGPAPIEPIAGVVDHEHQERGHDEQEIEAGELPPVGGLHSATWQNCGIYDQPISIENAVHSLEHGAMWIAYQPELSPDDVQSLQNKARGENYVLLSPYPGLKSPVVLTAWETQLELDSVEDERIEEFIDRYQQGPTTPERGASCQDGVGTPLS